MWSRLLICVAIDTVASSAPLFLTVDSGDRFERDGRAVTVEQSLSGIVTCQQPIVSWLAVSVYAMLVTTDATVTG